MKSSLLVISFMDCASGVVSKKSSPYPRSSRCSMLSSRSFIVLHFMFRSMIHFELIFVEGVRSVSRFSSLHVDVQLFQHCLLKSLSLLHIITFAILSKVSWLYLCGSVSGLSILFHWSVCLFFCQYHCLDYCSSIVCLEIRQC